MIDTVALLHLQLHHMMDKKPKNFSLAGCRRQMLQRSNRGAPNDPDLSRENQTPNANLKGGNVGSVCSRQFSFQVS